jgi:hypothetical protein
VIASGSAWHQGTGGAPLGAVLHYWAPYALVIAAAVAITAVAASLMLGRTSDDEQELDRVTAERRHREELARRRREARDNARRNRTVAGEGTTR